MERFLTSLSNGRPKTHRKLRRLVTWQRRRSPPPLRTDCMRAAQSSRPRMLRRKGSASCGRWWEVGDSTAGGCRAQSFVSEC